MSSIGLSSPFAKLANCLVALHNFYNRVGIGRAVTTRCGTADWCTRGKPVEREGGSDVARVFEIG